MLSLYSTLTFFQRTSLISSPSLFAPTVQLNDQLPQVVLPDCGAAPASLAVPSTMQAAQTLRNVRYMGYSLGEPGLDEPGLDVSGKSVPGCARSSVGGRPSLIS